LLYETQEEYDKDSLDGYSSLKEKQEAIRKTVLLAEGLHINPGERTSNAVLSKIKPRTVLEGFKESGYVDFVGQKIGYIIQELSGLLYIGHLHLLPTLNVLFSLFCLIIINQGRI
jgi:hypothetical protein